MKQVDPAPKIQERQIAKSEKRGRN